MQKHGKLNKLSTISKQIVEDNAKEKQLKADQTKIWQKGTYTAIETIFLRAGVNCDRKELYSNEPSYPILFLIWAILATLIGIGS